MAVSGKLNETQPTLPQFVTFYSYKGGVGRTLALANAALLLVRYGRKVLVIDADLEAPGLSHIPPFNQIPRDKSGFVDLLEATLSQLSTNDGGTWLSPEKSYTYPLKVSDFVEELRCHAGLKAHKAGRLAYIPAGAFTPDYARRVESLHIGQLYENGPGATIFRQLKEIIAGEDYDYVLIDSRTGWSDIGGTCTRDFADTVVLVCGLNEQNVQGTKQVMHAIEKGRGEEKTPEMILVASPVPNAEEDLKTKRVAAMSDALGRPPDVQLFYHPLLALEETTFVGRHEQSDLIRRYEDLTHLVLKKAGDYTDDWLQRAVSALNNNDVSAAEHAFIRAAITGREETVTLLSQFGQMVPIGIGRSLRTRRFINQLINKIVDQPIDENNLFGAYLGTLGDLTKETAFFKEAVDVFSDIIRQEPQAYGAFVNWGQTLLAFAEHHPDESLYREAFEKFEAAFKIKPYAYESLFNWGNALSKLAEQNHDESIYREAFEKFEAAVKIKPDAYESLFNWGNALFKLAEQKKDESLYQEVFEKFEAAVKIKPDAHESFFNWGIALSKLAEQNHDESLYREAFKKFEIAVEIKPDDYETFYNWGNGLLELANHNHDEALYQEAFEKLETAVEITPNNYEAFFIWSYGLLELAEQKHDEALYREAFKKFEGTLKIKSDDYYTLCNWGNGLLALGEQKHDESLYQEAFRKFEAALKLKPDNHDALFNWGNGLLALGEQKHDKSLYKEAFEKFEAAIKLEPKAYQVLNEWGTAICDIAEQKKDESLYQEAFEKFEAAFTIKPDDHEALYNWGNALSNLAKQKKDESLYQEAFQKFESALKIQPDLYDVLDDWGAALLELFHSTGRVELLALAEEKLRQAEDIEPGSGAYNLACALALQNRLDEALEWLAKAIAYDVNVMNDARDEEDLASLRNLEQFQQLTGQ